MKLGKLEGREIVIIGLGGIGCRLVRELLPYLAHLEFDEPVSLVDGDSFEESNHVRQDFAETGPKPAVLADMYVEWGLDLRPVCTYVAESNVASLIREGSVVLMGVDNHAARRLVSQHCVELDNVLLISGGNDYTDGNVQVYQRVDGVAQHPPLHDVRWHPEIANPSDRNPADMGCELLAATSAPQLGFTNNLITGLMLAALYAWQQGRVLKAEVYADLLTMNARAVDRPVEQP